MLISKAETMILHLLVLRQRVVHVRGEALMGPMCTPVGFAAFERGRCEG